MIKLKDSTISAIHTSVSNASSMERSDSATFLLAYKEYKGVLKGSRGHITNLLNVNVGIVTQSTNIKTAMTKVFKLAQAYVDMSIVCKFDNLEYTNISNLVKLFKYVDKHLSDKSVDLREEIKGVYEANMSPHRYNNLISSKITALKEEYKLKEQEEEFIFSDMFNMVQANINKMTNEQLLKMQELIVRNLTVQEVA